MNYHEALGWIYSSQVHGIRLGLENMRRLCDALEIDVTGGACKFIHIAGTNGKGSVCAMLAAILAGSGLRTGLYTSPHLVSFRERIRIGSNLIPDEQAADGLARIRDAIAGWEPAPTFFEIATALALDWFQRQHAEWVVLETGLGGRLDATNVVTPAVTVLTEIGLDHTQHLGTTLTDVAREKAGIIKPGVPVLSAPQPPEAEAVLRETAERIGAPLKFITQPVGESFQVALPGSHQRINAALAFAAAITAGLRPRPANVVDALEKVGWPGRFQRVNDGRLILDGAHNPAAAARLAQTWREEFGDEKPALILGVLADKDAAGICAALLRFASRVICVPVRNPRALPPEQLAAIVSDCAPEFPVVIAASLGDALAQTARERTLLTGSLFLVGETLAHLGLADGAHEWSAQ